MLKYHRLVFSSESTALVGGRVELVGFTAELGAPLGHQHGVDDALTTSAVSVIQANQASNFTASTLSTRITSISVGTLNSEKEISD